MEGASILPICKDAAGKFRFEGTFDGAGHTIRNLCVSTVEFYEEGNASGKPVGEVNPRGDSYNYGGFIATLGIKGVVKNLTFASDCKFDLFSSGGAVAGASYGLIENCKNFASVNVYFSSGGGIVGDMTAGSIVRNCYNGGIVRAGAYSAGGIVGTATNATIESCANAGFVGAVYINSYQKEGNQYKAGGIVGDNVKSLVLNVVNAGEVSSYKQMGGIVGYNNALVTAPAIVQNAVNYGFVRTLKETVTSGQIVGDNNNGTVVNSYFDIQLQKLDGVNNTLIDGVTALGTANMITAKLALPDSAWIQTTGSYPMLKTFKDENLMKLASLAIVNFGAKDFASCMRSAAKLGNTSAIKWSLTKGEAFKIANESLQVTIPTTGIARDTLTAVYAGLSRQIPLSTLNSKILDGEGTQAAPYLVKTAADMQKISAFIEDSNYDFEGDYFKVMNNLDFTSLEYTSIAQNGNMFQGTFDGNGKTITHLTYSTPATDKTVQERGLFGVVGRRGSISNLTIDETNKFESYQKCGAFVGGLYGMVKNCINKAAVSTNGLTNAGGVAGFAYSNSVISKCKNYGDITSKTGNAGGILGGSIANATVRIDSCLNEGLITATNRAAGIAGSASAIISACSNSGAVFASTSHAAGILAEALVSSGIEKSFNTGNVMTDQYLGGIVGVSVAHTNDMPFVVDSCYNVSDITPSVSAKAKGYAGGIGGQLKAGAKITNCYNKGAIHSDEADVPYLGGIVADIAGSSSGAALIENCYNTGNISGFRYLGGIAAALSGDENAKASKCYNTGTITSNNPVSSYAAGLIGNGGYNLFDSWNSGDVTGVANYVAGLAGYLTGKAYQFERCFNVGKITSSTDKGIQIGGLVGMGRPYMYDCYNFGEVTGYDNVGGLVGYPGNAMSPLYDVKLRRSYNAAKLTATGGNNIGNACSLNPSCLYLTVDSVYYDSSVSETYKNDKDYSVAATPAEICNLKLGDSFNYAVATYPSLKVHADNPVNSFYVAMVLLTENENLSDVKSAFKIGTPKGTEWTASENLKITGNDVKLANKSLGENATLTLKVGELTKTYELTLNGVPVGIGQNGIDGKTVISRTYYTTNGVVVDNPVQNGITIEKMVYDDGTTETRKVVSVER